MNEPTGQPLPAVGMSAMQTVDEGPYGGPYDARMFTRSAADGVVESATIVYDAAQFAALLNAHAATSGAANRHAIAAEAIAVNAGASAAAMTKQAAALENNALAMRELVAIMRDQAGVVSSETPLQMHVRYVESLAMNSDVTDKLAAKPATSVALGASVETQLGDMAAAMVADTLRRYPASPPKPDPAKPPGVF